MVRILTACLFLQFVSTLGTPTRGKFKAEYRQKLGENPEGVALTVRLESGRQWFRVGEVIRLQLSFTSQIPDKYQLNLRTCDRSGRLTLDLPCVNPTEGTVDPLAGYFGAIFGYIGVGASAPQKVLGQEPVSASLVLNEHLRFDRTGRYRLFIVSTRVEPIGHHRDLSVASNAIDLEILQADESWQKRQITGAVARLRDESDCTGQEEVCQILRYLGTTGTVEAILDEYPSTDEYCRSEFSFGLMGAPLPLRDYAVREMTLRLKDSHYPVRPRFFQDLVLLTYMTQHPDYIYSTGTPRANLLDRRRAYERISVQRLKDLVGAIEDKKGHALAVSALALLQSLRSTDVREAFEGNVEALRTRLPAVFGLLSRENQKTLLGYDWRVIRHPDLLPALRQIIDEKPRLLRRQEPVRDAALRRLYELAPAEGRQRILREIESGNSTFAATTLGILPDKTLPELDDELMTQVESSTTDLDRVDLSSHLVARYASDSILPRVLRWVRPRLDNYACRPLYALTAYTLRVSPEDGLGLVREVLCIRKRTGCFRSILKSVADLHIDSGLVTLAVESLEDADLDVVTSAAETLRDYGTAGARDALWQQLAYWHQEAVNQGMDPAGPGSAREWTGWRPQRFLALALAEGHGWRLDLHELHRIRDLSLHDSVKAELSLRIRQAMQEPQINVSLDLLDHPSFTVDSYESGSLPRLKQKLLQFPAGTIFRWLSFLPPGWEREEAEFFAVSKEYLQQHSMGLVRQSQSR